MCQYITTIQNALYSVQNRFVCTFLTSTENYFKISRNILNQNAFIFLCNYKFQLVILISVRDLWATFKTERKVVFSSHMKPPCNGIKRHSKVPSPKVI